MNVVAKLKDGREFEIPCVKWHPPVYRQGWREAPGELWVLENDVINKLSTFFQEPVTRHIVQTQIDGAEAPICIYMDCEDHEPWRHYGLLVKTILPSSIKSLPHTFSFDGDY